VPVRTPEPLDYAIELVSIVAAGRVAIPLDPAAPAAEKARVLSVAEEAMNAAPTEYRASVSELRDRPAGGIFLCTSGTTGTPKGILLREDQLCHVAASVADAHRLTPADRGYCCLPLFHVNAEVVGILATLRAGACLVLDRKFSRGKFWDLIGERRITWINAVPAIIALLTLEPGVADGTIPDGIFAGGVRFVRSASAPLPAATLARFEGMFGIPVIETYGMTEAASMITASPLDGPRKPCSAGVPAGTEVRIVTEHGPDQPGVVGRVQIRGAGVITRYASGGRSGAIDPDGWLDTGDLGHLDQDGYLFLAGRSDDVINRGGEKIYPREIEDFLIAHGDVLTAAVVGARDDVLGERPVAYVVPARAGRADHIERALREACAAALPRYKRPTAIHVVEALPTGPTGKVARNRLVQSTPIAN
jgi:acyl-CoA synthetase (AMP-forming)/AMP-acid ligase II